MPDSVNAVVMSPRSSAWPMALSITRTLTRLHVRCLVYQYEDRRDEAPRCVEARLIRAAPAIPQRL